MQLGDPRVPGGRGLIAVALLLAGSACARAPAESPAGPPAGPPLGIAVLPARWANAEGAFDVDAFAAVARGLRASPRVRAIDARAASVGEPETCAEEVACASRAGARVGARKAIAVRLAGLGDTVLIRVAVVDVARGTQELTRQEVVRGADAARVTAALARVATEIARPWTPAPPPAEGDGATPWVLAALGAAATAGAAIAIGLAASSEGEERGPDVEERPDVVITPP